LVNLDSDSEGHHELANGARAVTEQQDPEIPVP
jgi:hypothetical protein